MCGIVGYTGRRTALPILLGALKRLEYRGYDSAGVAVLGSELEVCKDKGEIAALERILPPLAGHVGIAHTRWATHGAPSKPNAHPFLDCTGKLALAHNGIIENYAALRERLKAAGHTFASETDTETVVHLVEEHYAGSLEQAVMEALQEVEGTYALLLVHANEPGKVVAARRESPLVIGLGQGENFVASDVPALLSETNRALYVMDDEVAVLTPDGARLLDRKGNPVERAAEEISWTVDDAQKGGFEHFMLKEIFEQPEAIHKTLLGRLRDTELEAFLRNHFTSVKLVACGTSFHAAMVGKYLIEEIAQMPATAELASEYRYSAPAGERPLVILLSQSGETADTVAAGREARRRGLRTLVVTNVVGSSLTRLAGEDRTRHVFYTHAGPEIGVAATKTFTAQLVALTLVAIHLGLAKGTLREDEAKHHLESVRLLPRDVAAVLNEEEAIEELAHRYQAARDVFFIGRGIQFPIALEGALKLKEISYVHAEGYAAGELKHGPLALLTPDTPIVALAYRDPSYAKMLGNIGEVSARGSPVIALGTVGDKDLANFVDDVVYIPSTKPFLAAVPLVVALQLFAYHVARERGCPIDKPRNLAKSVTVE